SSYRPGCMLSIKENAVRVEKREPMESINPHRLESEPAIADLRWRMGIERRQVAIYVAIALIGGFAIGFVTSRYATTGNQQNPLVANSREAATLAGAAAVTDTN